MGILYPLDYGLIPYRSEGRFAANRIVFDKTPEEIMKRLITETELTKSKSKPNPVLRIAMLAEMARQHLRIKENPNAAFGYIDLHGRFYDMKEGNRINPYNLREFTLESL